MNNIVILKFLFHENFDVLSDAISFGIEKGGIEVEEAITSKEAATILGSYSEGGIVFASLKTKEDMLQIASFLKIESKMIMKTINFKFIIFDFANNNEFKMILAKLSVTEILRPDLQSRILKRKMGLWLSTYLEKKKDAPITDTKINNRSEDIPRNDLLPNEKLTFKVNWTEPLDIEDDIWLIKDTHNCKNILSNWLIPILGPSPAIGKWQKENENVWQYVVHEKEKSTFIPKGGNWYFRGEHAPEFKWDENLWFFKGSEFELYYQGHLGYFTRFKALSEKAVDITKNSIFALNKEQLIYESFKMEYVLDDDGPSVEDELSIKLDEIGSADLSYENKNIKNDDQVETQKHEDDSLIGLSSESNQDLPDGDFNNHREGRTEQRLNPVKKNRETMNPLTDTLEIIVHKINRLMSNPILNASLEMNDQLLECCFYDYFDSKIVVFIHERNIEKKNKVKMKLEYKLSEDIGSFEIDGVVINIQETSDGGSYLLVEINAADSNLELFIMKYKITQMDIVDLFILARGA
jgi:hypothetical protein